MRYWAFQVTWTGHKRAVTALRYNRAGGMLASGSQDTDIILWDVVGETGLFRLRAHTAEVTNLVRALLTIEIAVPGRAASRHVPGSPR